MTVKILSPDSMCEVLDALAEGCTITEAMQSVGAKETAFWTWKSKSRAALREADFTTYYIPSWHGRVGFFHELCAVAQQPSRTRLPEPQEQEKPKSVSPFPRPMSDLERDLRDKLAEVHGNPNRITRPGMPVHIERDAPDDAQRERINNPSDQSGLPVRAPDEPREALPPQQVQIDYSRRRVARVDAGGMGRGVVPPGGFRVA